MEMGCLWFGDTDGSFFTFDDLSKCRKIKTPMETHFFKNKKIPDLALNEKRIMSVDIALMGSSKSKNNDAS